MDDGRIEIGNPQYESLYGIWRENKEPGQISKGSFEYKVIKPDGIPIFVPITMGLNEAYAQTSKGSGGRKRR